MKEDTDHWKDNPCSWIRLLYIKMSLLPKVIYKFNVILIKILKVFCRDRGGEILVFIQNHKRPKMDKVIMRKKNKATDSTLLDFKVYYKGIVIKIV